MKIAIDASRAVNEKAGIGRYALELVKKLVEIDQKNEYLLLFSFVKSDPLKLKIIKSFKGPNVSTKIYKIPGNVKEKVWGWKIPWFKYLLGKADVFYAPSFFEVNLGLKIPQVVTIYDLTTFLFPEHRGQEVSGRLNRRTRQACRKAAKIIAISEATGKDLVEKLKVAAAKIKVIYPGRNALAKPVKNLPASLKRGAYILSVGTLEPRKNLIGLFKAYALLPLRLRERYPLVVCGAKGWNTGEIFATLSKLKLEDKVKFLGFVSDGTLAKLYAEAAIFVYPSFYEGFGFPVLEALSFGTPVLTSNVSSLPEVAGQAAILVDPKETNAISRGIQQVLEHQEEACELKKRGKKQAQKFSWEKAAKEMIKVFEEVGDKDL